MTDLHRLARRTLLALAATALLSPSLSAQEAGPAYESADELLIALETADEDVRTLRCSIAHTKLFALAGDLQQRRGTLVYTTDPRQRFSISFEQELNNDQVRSGEKIYIFDGEWLVEKDPSAREFVKTRIVRPGEAFDPLRIGEGPFPVPIGQKRDEILERFSAELAPAGAGLDDFEAQANAAESAEWIQLRLTPTPLFGEETDLTEVRVWYDADDLLPRMAKTVNRIGDESLVYLYSVKKNDETAEAEFSVETPGDDEGWNVTLRDRTGVAAQIEVTP